MCFIGTVLLILLNLCRSQENSLESSENRMSLSFQGSKEEALPSKVTLLASSSSLMTTSQNSSELIKRNYMGFSDCSTFDISRVCKDDCKGSLNHKATELRLGLPGSESPERNTDACPDLDKKPLFPLRPSNESEHSLQSSVSSGNKRGFSRAMDGFTQGNLLANSELNAMLSARPSSDLGPKGGSKLEPDIVKDMKTTLQASHGKTPATKEGQPKNVTGNNSSTATATPAPKAQVVGWPPVKSFRKNSLAIPPKSAEQVEDAKEAAGTTLFIKVSMDGAPYLRKVDLYKFAAYQELCNALQKMFSCFTLGQYGSQGSMNHEVLSERKLRDLLDGSEYVLAYEDKDGDWMLVGDVPWEMFIGTCRRLRMMKSSDAIGLAPRGAEKCRGKN
ncbi:hypothetical protein CDL15_Pgr011491 [Punica granatum]|uniref:Auxin-responsive protein n=1 Tax=Punica granatum TaxID=22663 RepID=A0A218WH68_PUNGR|nr:hypothetical protein CDL15_Pgr011491 [Punica granatum]